MSTPKDKDHRRGELTVSRVVDAPRDLVWQAFSELEHLAAFWGGPGITVPVESVTMGVRPGGNFELAMVSTDGAEYPNRGEYVEVDKPGRLVFREPDTGITATITFAMVGDKTEVTIHQVGVPERILGPKAGFAATFDKLEALVDRWLNRWRTEAHFGTVTPIRARR
jgi:uncharacterized protein YndB with AHSA1/START domain